MRTHGFPWFPRCSWETWCVSHLPAQVMCRPRRDREHEAAGLETAVLITSLPGYATITCETNRTDRILAFSSFGTLKFGYSTLKSIFSTLKFVFSKLKFVSSILKFVFDAFQHSEMGVQWIQKPFIAPWTLFFRVLGIWMGCMQLKNRCWMRSSTLKWMLDAFQHSEMRVQWIQK